MTSPRMAAMLGVLTPLYFLAIIAVFGMLTPGYAHASKAVSELGAAGAPFMLEWNVLGFGLTGLFLALFGIAFPGPSAARWPLVLTGVAFAATAIPADMENYRSLATMAHFAVSAAVFVAWIWALGSMMAGPSKVFRMLAIFFLALATASIALRASGWVWPGTGQRASFAVFFGWYFFAGLWLCRHRP